MTSAAVIMLALLQVAPFYARRIYHTIRLEQLENTRWTHVCVTGTVAYVRYQRDGDWHITLDNGRAKVVIELIPQLKLTIEQPDGMFIDANVAEGTPVRKGQRVEACGITRVDQVHRWAEIHPVERLRVLR